ncbi:hypothetical protein GPECTOR_180g251 [Gonium pectorale]|uniref:Protein kinase domain-containing protein n=1 Tax=Gonium pectorale TaxID=33097 RepID=A0A150FYD7_GONPE|nr:hypothetical protein GPECTOR_180g251 [Gonium pectorale]|eukprot:KXZ42215.1 hypothetical protein GPECTOR_180g251 [Gonium pectorale]
MVIRSCFGCFHGQRQRSLPASDRSDVPASELNKDATTAECRAQTCEGLPRPAFSQLEALPVLHGEALGQADGQGAQGAVLKAQWRSGCTVAVKWLVTDAADVPAAYLEALLAKMMAHPFLVQTFEAAICQLDDGWDRTSAPQQQRHQQRRATHQGHWEAAGGGGGGRDAIRRLDMAGSSSAGPGPSAAALAVAGAMSASSGATGVSNSCAGAGAGAGASAPAGGCSGAAGVGSATGAGAASPRAPLTPPGHDDALSPFDTDAMTAERDSFDGDAGGVAAAAALRPVECKSVLRQLGAAPGKYVVQIVSEWCDEGTLHAAIRGGVFRPAPPARSRTWALRALLRTAKEVALGMCHLHSLGVIHGDLKPGNVLLKSSRVDSRGFVAKVADFGLSRLLRGPGEQYVATEQWATVPYMAGEYLDNRLCKSSDVYSFGVLLWQMYTGKKPFSEHLEAQVAVGVMLGTLSLEWPAGMPPPLLRLGQQCCRHEPEGRPTFKAACCNVSSWFVTWPAAPRMQEVAVALAGMELQVREASARAKLTRRYTGGHAGGGNNGGGSVGVAGGGSQRCVGVGGVSRAIGGSLVRSITQPSDPADGGGGAAAAAAASAVFSAANGYGVPALPRAPSQTVPAPGHSARALTGLEAPPQVASTASAGEIITSLFSGPGANGAHGFPFAYYMGHGQYAAPGGSGSFAVGGGGGDGAVAGAATGLAAPRMQTAPGLVPAAAGSAAAAMLAASVPRGVSMGGLRSTTPPASRLHIRTSCADEGPQQSHPPPRSASAAAAHDQRLTAVWPPPPTAAAADCSAFAHAFAHSQSPDAGAAAFMPTHGAAHQSDDSIARCCGRQLSDHAGAAHPGSYLHAAAGASGGGGGLSPAAWQGHPAPWPAVTPWPGVYACLYPYAYGPTAHGLGQSPAAGVGLASADPRVAGDAAGLASTSAFNGFYSGVGESPALLGESAAAAGPPLYQPPQSPAEAAAVAAAARHFSSANAASRQPHVGVHDAARPGASATPMAAKACLGSAWLLRACSAPLTAQHFVPVAAGHAMSGGAAAAALRSAAADPRCPRHKPPGPLPHGALAHGQQHTRMMWAGAPVPLSAPKPGLAMPGGVTPVSPHVYAAFESSASTQQRTLTSTADSCYGSGPAEAVPADGVPQQQARVYGLGGYAVQRGCSAGSSALVPSRRQRGQSGRAAMLAYPTAVVALAGGGAASGPVAAVVGGEAAATAAAAGGPYKDPASPPSVFSSVSASPLAPLHEEETNSGC